MKLTPEKASALVAILDAQSGVKKIDDKDAYKAQLAEVADLLNSKTEGEKTLFTGGVVAEVYKDNKDNAELVRASKAHLAKAKDRADKAAEKAQAKSAPAPKKGTPRTPEQEAKSATAIVDYCNAVAGVKRITKVVDGKEVNDPAGFRAASIAVQKYIDHKNGGLLNTAPEGKKSPWERFSSFPGVKEACKAHKKALKDKAKAAPEMA